MEKICEADIEISQNNISVCDCQGRKQEGKQPILVKFICFNKRNEVQGKKKDLRNKGVSVQEDLTQVRAKMLKFMVNSNAVNSVGVTNGKIYAYRKEGQKYVKLGCTTKPEDLLAVRIEADYDFLGLTKYIVEMYDFNEDDEICESDH